MSALALPKSSRLTMAVAVVTFAAALYRLMSQDGRELWLVPLAFLISGFLADLFTAVAHFCFDYVFSEEIPIMGPIALEFREHHECPTLDPEDYVVNLTKGAYCSLPLSLAAYAVSKSVDGRWTSFLAIATLLCMSLWAFFFHQIHSYTHMGSSLPPDEFKRRVRSIGLLPDQDAQMREFARLFETVRIPPAVRLLQRCRLILDPRTHNFHHLSFESDFSSVNGWSDPIIDLILRPLARRMKARSTCLRA